MTNGKLMKTLLTLGKKNWTGCLRVIDRSTGESAGVYLYNGDLYAVEIDGFRPDLGLRLGAAGILTAERLSLFEGAVPVSERATSLGRFVLDQQWVSVDKLAQIHGEYLLAGLGAVIATMDLNLTPINGSATGQYCALPTSIEGAFETVGVRQARSERVWTAVSSEVAPGPIVLKVTNPNALVQPSPEFDAMMKVADGILSLDEVAGRCGLSRAEGIFIGAALIDQGLMIAGGVKGAAQGPFLVPEEFGSRKVSSR